MSETKPIRFFLGANSPQGFFSLFDELEHPHESWHTFLIKGGPGCGKSGFLKKTAALHSDEEQMELCPCSSDPDSLDAVILPRRHISLMDATAPHAKEAAIPAVRHTILSFGDQLNGSALQEKRREIEAICASSPEYYKLAVSYLYAAQVFLQNSYEIADHAADREKIEGYARRFAAKHFPQQNGAGREKIRFLSTICADGIVTLEETPALLCRKLYLIDDDCGAVSHRLLSALRRLALNAGHEVISCFCPMAPMKKLEHLFIPTADVAFLTSNHFHSMTNCGAVRKIHARRFQDQELMKLKRERFAYNRKAAQTLLEQAISILGESRRLHDRLEQLYIAAMDFPALEARFPQFLKMIQDYSY